MPRQKRTSDVLEIARQRLAGLKRITPKPDFGPVLTEAAYEAEVEGFINEQDKYNGDIAELDDASNRLNEREQRLADFNQRILAAVKAIYGPDSSEFEEVGGIRRSDRKRPTRKSKVPAAA